MKITKITKAKIIELLISTIISGTLLAIAPNEITTIVFFTYTAGFFLGFFMTKLPKLILLVDIETLLFDFIISGKIELSLCFIIVILILNGLIENNLLRRLIIVIIMLSPIITELIPGHQTGIISGTKCSSAFDCVEKDGRLDCNYCIDEECKEIGKVNCPKKEY